MVDQQRLKDGVLGPEQALAQRDRLAIAVGGLLVVARHLVRRRQRHQVARGARVMRAEHLERELVRRPGVLERLLPAVERHQHQRHVRPRDDRIGVPLAERGDGERQRPLRVLDRLGRLPRAVENSDAGLLEPCFETR